ncbi:Glutamate dehydrogenase, NAD-specific [Parasponia andersonii]|uniref:Glutamate dehydrogenase, NAD-specific n=1 Tax=Parasponia andersonii TaxID=3476 RepID=A0A2P5C6G5_PARAD|nr:Glutamate dehydrogenase, NAD-specific [Parasponia andersonii]
MAAALAELLPVEEVLQELLHLGNPGRTSNKDHVMNTALVHLCIPQTLLNRLHTLPKEIHVELLKSSTSNRRVIINTVEKGINFKGSLSGRGESPLGPLTSSPKPPKSSWVATDVLFVLTLKILDKMVHHSVTKIFTSKLSVTSCSLYFKYTLFNCQQGHIKSPTTQINDLNILLPNTSGLFIKTMSNGGRSRLIDDTHNIQASNDTSILSSLTLTVIEVSRDSNNSVLDGCAKVRLGNLTHLCENHRGDFLSRELLLFTLAVDNNHGFIASTSNHLEWPELHVTLNRQIRKSSTN